MAIYQYRLGTVCAFCGHLPQSKIDKRFAAQDEQRAPCVYYSMQAARTPPIRPKPNFDDIAEVASADTPDVT